MNETKTPLTNSVVRYDGAFPHPQNEQFVLVVHCRAVEQRLNECVEALEKANKMLEWNCSDYRVKRDVQDAIANARKPL